MSIMVTRPAENAVSVTTNDSTDLATDARGVYVGVGGDLKVTLVGGTTVTFANLAAGVIHPIQARRIWATGTDAADILGIY